MRCHCQATLAALIMLTSQAASAAPPPATAGHILNQFEDNEGTC
jgi:hypothetical protein